MARYSAIIWSPEGGHAIIHSSKPIRACSFCEMELSTSLCDYVMGLPVGLDPSEPNLCSRPIGLNCRLHVEPDTDYCPNHDHQ